jgi:hypothetical protein
MFLEVEVPESCVPGDRLSRLFVRNTHPSVWKISSAMADAGASTV